MRVPVHIVAGTGGSDKSALIARLCAQRPDWLGLVETMPAGAPANVRLLAAGCPCCVGKIVLQVVLARALREARPVRAFVELPDVTHAASLERALTEAPLGRSIARGRPIVLPKDREVEPAAFGD